MSRPFSLNPETALAANRSPYFGHGKVEVSDTYEPVENDDYAAFSASFEHGAGVIQVSRVAAGLGVSWSAANNAVLSEGRRRLIDDPHRFDQVTAIGVDEGLISSGLASVLVGAGMLSVLLFPLIGMALRGDRVPSTTVCVDDEL